MKRAHVILNKRAGGLINGDAESALRRIMSRLTDAGWSASACCPQPDELETHMRGLAPELDIVVTAGGDGTLAGVASNLIGRRTALAILPLGTLNVLAEDLNIPLDLDEALDAVLTGRRDTMDVATVNGRAFFIQAVLGVAADLAERREKMRGAESVTAWAEFANGVAADLLSSAPVHYSVRTARRYTSTITRTLIISNNRLKHRHRLLPYRRTLKGQVLALYALEAKGPLSALRFAVQAVLPGKSNPSVRELVSDRIVLNADIEEGRAIVDGEIVKLDFPAVFELAPQALNVIVPRR